MTTLKKVLIIGAKGSGKLSLLKALTGSLPADIETSHGGLTHEYSVKNKYYEASIGIWVDEFTPADSTSFFETYVSEAASEVRNVLGVIIFTFTKSSSAADISNLLEQTKAIADTCPLPPLLLAISKSSPSEDSFVVWEDVCLDEGFEYIDLSYNKTTKNEFGESAGIERVKEVIQANDWSETVEDPSPETLLDQFNVDQELSELLLPSGDGDTELNESSVEAMEQMMSRVAIAREQMADLSPSEREVHAAKLVAEIMKSTTGI